MEKNPKGTISKPESFRTVIQDAHARIDYLTKICKLWVTAPTADERRRLKDLIAAATRHGMDSESEEDPHGSR